MSIAFMRRYTIHSLNIHFKYRLYESKSNLLPRNWEIRYLLRETESTPKALKEEGAPLHKNNASASSGTRFGVPFCHVDLALRLANLIIVSRDLTRKANMCSRPKFLFLKKRYTEVIYVE